MLDNYFYNQLVKIKGARTWKDKKEDKTKEK